MGATSQLSEKKLRNDSEPRCRGCLNWLKKCKHPEKCKKSSNQLKIKIIINSKISAKGGPVFTLSLPGGAACSLTPPSVTPLFSVRLCGWCMISVHSEKIGRQARISAFSGCVNSCKKFFSSLDFEQPLASLSAKREFAFAGGNLWHPTVQAGVRALGGNRWHGIANRVTQKDVYPWKFQLWLWLKSYLYQITTTHYSVYGRPFTRVSTISVDF